MKLTKEKCLKALDNIEFLGGINIQPSSLEVIDNLINECFDNPPNIVKKEHLIQWYITSAGRKDVEWSEEHIDELLRDFNVYFKNEIDYNSPLEFEQLEVGVPYIIIYNNFRIDVLITKILGYDKLYEDNRVEFIWVNNDGTIIHKRLNFKDCIFYSSKAIL